MLGHEGLFGELRSVLQRGPDAQTWQQLCAQLDLWRFAAFEEVALPYALAHLERWPDALRVAPKRWAAAVCEGFAQPRALLCRTFHPGGHDGDMGEALRGMARSTWLRSITHLSLENSYCYDAGAAIVASCENLPALEQLTMACCDLTADGLRALARSRTLTALRSLDLFENHIGEDVTGRFNEAVVELVRSPTMRAMRQLDLSANDPIDDDVARELFSSPHLGALSELDLSFTDISDAALDSLIASPMLSQLTALKLSYCPISAQGVEALRAARPDVALTWERPAEE